MITAYFSQLAIKVFGDFEDFFRIAHRSDDGDLVAHEVEEIDGHRLFVHGDDAEPRAGLGEGQCGFDDHRCSGGVEIDVGIHLSAEHRCAFAMKLEKSRGDVFLGRVDHRIGAHLQGLLEPRRDQVGDHDMADAKGFERDGGAQPDRARTEDQHLVGRFGLAPVDAVPGHGHRFVEGGDFERDVVGHHLQARASHRVLEQQVFGQCAAGCAVADDSVRRRHRVDDDVIAHRDTNDVTTNLDHFAGRLVPEWHAAVMAGDTAHRDEKRVGAADSACPDLDEHIGRTDRGFRRVDHLRLAGCCHDGHLHVHAPLRG
jgi:hypothetical protein